MSIQMLSEQQKIFSKSDSGRYDQLLVLIKGRAADIIGDKRIVKEVGRGARGNVMTYEKDIFDITERGLELASLEAGDRVLDIGCGAGDDVAYFSEKKGLKAEGIDISLAAISEAREKHPDIAVKFGDGEFLDDYSSFTFDGVFMQDVLRLINLPDEALHEAYCVLKKGGKLVIVDEYHKDPDPKKMKAVAIEAQRQSKIPHKEGDCETDPVRFVDFRFDGAFYEGPLKRQLEETGYVIKIFEDVTDAVEAGPQEGKTGRFLLVAEKPKA